MPRASLPPLARIARTPRRDAGATRTLYGYPAKFQARLPAELVRRYSSPGELVVDPYCGGGTTALEAYLERRAFTGVDLNPLACLVARVKTTPLPAAAVRAAAAAVVAERPERPGPPEPGDIDVLDAEDEACLGAGLARETRRLAAGAAALAEPALRDAARLALLSALRQAGRRDSRTVSLVPLFLRRAEIIARAVSALPTHEPRARIHLGTAAALPIAEGAAALVVTSPPYKDVDVEYALVQLQRPALGRSKRSHIAWRLLGERPLSKRALCGGTGAAYWKNLAPALAETRRVLAPGRAAFFWTGFKTVADRHEFEARLAAAGLPAQRAIRVTLGRDRLASSRSVHHGRATGLLGHDFLYFCVAS